MPKFKGEYIELTSSLPILASLMDPKELSIAENNSLNKHLPNQTNYVLKYHCLNCLSYS